MRAIVVLLLTAATAVLGQSPPNDIDAILADLPPVVTWKPDSLCCSKVWHDGTLVLNIEHDNISVTVSMTYRHRKSPAATVGIANSSGHEFDVIPERWWLQVESPRRKLLSSIPDEKLAGDIKGLGMRRTTLAPGHSLVGIIFFKEDRLIGETGTGRLYAEIGGYVFSFGLERSK